MHTFLVELLIVPIKISFLSAKNILLPEQHSRAAEYARRGSIPGKNVFFFSVASSRPFRGALPDLLSIAYQLRFLGGEVAGVWSRRLDLI